MYKIALVGQAGSGKDTAASLIEEELNKHHQFGLKSASFAFADPIKEIIKLMFPKVKRKHLYGPSKFRSTIIEGAIDAEGNPLTIRRALLDIGTKVGRGYDNNCWVNNMKDRIDDAIKKKCHAVLITDCRFTEESIWLKDNGFLLVNIMREDGPKIDHISETDQKNITGYDFVIDNRGALDDLKRIVKKHLIPLITNLQSIAQ